MPNYFLTSLLELKFFFSFQDNGKGAGRGDLEVRDETRVSIPNLHPYSEYRITVKALPDYITMRSVGRPEEEEIDASTSEGIPNVKPTGSIVPSTVTSTSLKLNWNVPLSSDCEHFNANLDGFAYILKGIEPWNDDYTRHSSTTNTFETFDNLMPFSDYILFVYVRTAAGLYNPDLSYKIPAETNSAKEAGVPRNLRVTLTRDGSQHHATWLPPYPPTGVIYKYVLRWKFIESEVWSELEEVLPSSDLCSSLSSTSVNYATNQYEKRICFTLDSPKSNVSYQVAAYNAGSSRPGSWTNSVYPIIQSGGDGSSMGIIIAGCISGLVAIALIVICIFCLVSKWNKDTRYKNIPTYVRTHPRGITNSLQRGNDNQNQRPNSLPPPWTPPLTRQSSGASSQTSKYHHLLVPINNTSRRSGSIQEQPLPPVPGSDPLYEELPQDKLDHVISRNTSMSQDATRVGNRSIDAQTGSRLGVPSHIRVSFNSVNEKSDEEDEEFLQPKTIVQDEDGYLKPKALQKSDIDSENEDEYLKPTFNKFQRIDSRDLSPPHEEPPSIPMQSYVPVPSHNTSNYSNQSKSTSQTNLNSSYVPIPAQRKKSKE